MKKIGVIAVIILLFGSIGDHTIYAPQHGPENTESLDTIIDETTNTITIEVKESTKELMQILDETIVNGRIPIFKALKNKRRSRKKIKTTANNLEKIIHNIIAQIEQNGILNPAIREKTDKFVSKTKKRVFDMHKQMVSQVKKLVGKKRELVLNNTEKTKHDIAQFEEKIILKIAKFSDKLKKLLKQG